MYDMPAVCTYTSMFTVIVPSIHTHTHTYVCILHSLIKFLLLAEMIDDQELGFFANFLGIFIFVLVVAYHYAVADPKYE